MREIASPWKMGSNRITLAPTTTATAVSSTGRKTYCAGIDHGMLKAHALLAAQFDEVHQDWAGCEETL
jgi:hypothetical protein